MVRPSINPSEVPGKVMSRTTRGRAEMRRDASKRRLCQWYERGDSYGYLDPKGFLARQSSAQNPSGAARPGHRIRNTYNYIRPIVQGKVSAASQRVPSYEILPSNTNPQNIAAARIAEQVALYGYDKWRIKAATVKACTLAIGGGGDAFAFPYFDPNVGPYTTNALTGEVVGQGEIKIQILSGNEVYWEPGVDFVDSPWYAIELARPIYEVKEIPGFFGKTLVPDASTSDLPTEKSNNNDLVMVTEYYERPCPKYPQGMRIVMANNRVIVDNRRIDPQAESNFEDYPLKDAQGRAIDEPILHRLQWTPSATGECDLGLTWQLIDFQRTMQDCMNKLMEWKNRCLNPKKMAPRGSNFKPATDDPGGIDYYDVVNGGVIKPEWESVPQGFAQPLIDIFQLTQNGMQYVGFDNQLAADANVAARTVTAVIEQTEAKWSAFLGGLADWHARVMRHSLVLVRNHYSEERVIAIRGRFGPDAIHNFTGAQLMDQVDVRVLPGSLDFMTKDKLVERVFAYADRQWITGQQAMLAIDAGTSDVLVQSMELDIARIDRIIRKIRDGSVMDMPTRQETETDPLTGQTRPVEVPSWMPLDHVDNLKVWHERLSDWMKTDDYDTLSPEKQAPAKWIMQGIEQLQAQQAQRAIEQQNAQAEQAGLKNAARPQGAKPMPDQPKPGAGTPELQTT